MFVLPDTGYLTLTVSKYSVKLFRLRRRLQIKTYTSFVFFFPISIGIFALRSLWL